MTDHTLYFTELLGLRVYDLKDRVLGRVRDAALVPVIHPTRIDRFMIGGGGYALFSIRFDQVATISLDGIRLSDEQLVPFHTSDEYVLRLDRDLLDQQIIDAQGRKVVRVTDITFDIHPEGRHDTLRVVEVDVGIRAVFRRLAQGVLPRRLVRKIQRGIQPNSIRWELCNILEPDPQRRLRLNITTDLLEQMHPADLADIVEELSPEDREAIIRAVDAETAAGALSEVDTDIQTQIIESLEAEKAADILEEMEPDEAADVLSELEEERSEQILEEMESDTKADVEELLEYDEDTAGGLMAINFISVYEGATTAEALEAIRTNHALAEIQNTVFLTDLDGRLKATVPVARVLLARPQTRLSELATDELIEAPVEEAADRVIEKFDKYNLITLPVVDEEGRLAGVITADDVITALRQR